MFRNVLVLSPHTDDGELGAGGTISRLVEEGDQVAYLAFSSMKPILERECSEALRVLGVENAGILRFAKRSFPKQRQEILQYLYDYNASNDVDLVLTPSTLDLHQDHQVVTNECLRAFKHSTILGYELPWNNIVFHQNCFIPLNKRHIEKKLEALWKYQTQIGKPYFDRDYLRGLARSRGVQVGVKYAEAFEVIKLVLNQL